MYIGKVFKLWGGQKILYLPCLKSGGTSHPSSLKLGPWLLEYGVDGRLLPAVK